MEQTLAFQCPICHVPIRPEYYFCYNCGKNLKQAPPSTSLSKQFLIYAGSIFLPPMGLVWGIRYLRVQNVKSRAVGVIAIILTLVSLVVSTKLAVDYINKVNAEVNRQLNGLQGF